MRQFTSVLVCAFALLAFVGAEENASTSEENGVVPTRDNSLNEMVIEFLENFKQTMVCGNPAMGIPVLAPFHLDHFEIDVDEKGLKFKGQVDDVSIDGLNEFEIKKIDIKMLKLQMDFEFFFGSIRSKGHYKVKGKTMSLFPFNRSGRFRFNANGLTLKGSVKVGLNGDKIEIRELLVTPTIKSVKSDIKNAFLVPFSNFIFNRIVESVVPNLINDNQPAITELIEQSLKPLINGKLGDLSLQDLIDMVTNGGGESSPVTC
ncbi:uncharacterized protein LOC128730668 [Anopheles nili]|uniref:uncharacterized protein LOC128730668 n=1 Tax=Anopheles nili TaxID=185578 RepID=UPI00237B4FAA|nr:uncharacterized protein LOC128730668 [Anopheles nili]